MWRYEVVLMSPPRAPSVEYSTGFAQEDVVQHAHSSISLCCKSPPPYLAWWDRAAQLFGRWLWIPKALRALILVVLSPIGIWHLVLFIVEGGSDVGGGDPRIQAAVVLQ